MNHWIFQEATEGDLEFKLVEFQILNHKYIMIFSIAEQEAFGYKADELGVKLPNNSYEVKFDLEENFHSGEYFKAPLNHTPFRVIRELGLALKSLLQAHYEIHQANAYIFVASRLELKGYYDALAKRYRDDVAFEVINNLGEEELGYVLTTPKFHGR